MAYVDLATIQDTDPGDILTAAWCDQARDNQEFFIDPPACSVYHNTTQTKSSSTSLSTALANSENYDNASMHSTSSNTSRITIQTAGRYEVGVVLSWAANSTNNRATAFLVNGTTDYIVDLRVSPSVNSAGISGSRTLVLSAGDYVEVAVWQNSGGDLALTLTEFYAIFRTR